jgi:NET1-associated nuclear protein 1 (U3 small nucleolar RNA-associated protein 17)
LTYRADIPKHATWSPDGSLLAVSFGPHAVLYEPTTNVVLQTLTSVHSEDTLSAHFVGPSGRYIAVVSAHNVLLWDLLDHAGELMSS